VCLPAPGAVPTDPCLRSPRRALHPTIGLPIQPDLLHGLYHMAHHASEYRHQSLAPAGAAQGVISSLQGTMSNLAQREAQALANYKNSLAGYLAKNVTSDCLSYKPYYFCLQAFPRCRLGRNEDLCSFVCEEHARRCLNSNLQGCPAPIATDGVCTSAFLSSAHRGLLALLGFLVVVLLL
jgi:hypothetical protein